MSKWGLSYKGVEILTPEEWNSVVDALNELNNRTPVETKGGIKTFSGDGITVTFNIPHGISTTPTTVSVAKAISNLPDIDYIEADATNIKVTFKSPPASGTDNVKIYYIALRL
jgi:hypothetical protein